MGKHTTQPKPSRIAAVWLTALVALSPVALTSSAVAGDVTPAVTSVDAIDPGVQAWKDTCWRLGYRGVPDAPAGNNLEIPWTGYDERGWLFAVRPWDNEWVTYTEYVFQSSDGTWYWKVVAVTKDGKPILSPVGQGLNVKYGWRTTDVDPSRAEFIVPMFK